MNSQQYYQAPQQQQQPTQQQGWSSYNAQSNNMPSNGFNAYNGYSQSQAAPTNGYAINPVAAQNMAAQMFAAHQGFLQQSYYNSQNVPMGIEQQPQINGLSTGYNGTPAAEMLPYNNNRYAQSSNSDHAQWGTPAAPSESNEQQLFNRTNSGINFDNYENIPVKVSGEDAPKSIEAFSEAGLHPLIQDNVDKSGYTKPTPVQKYSIPTLVANRDLMSCAQTGSGKTAAFLLPILNHIINNGPEGIKQATTNSMGRRTFYPAALVLSPTRELAIQIHKEASKFSYRTNIITSILYGGRENYRDQVNRLRAGVHILIATPGRLIDIIDQGYIGLQGCRYLVLDEADRMLDMGFEPQIRKIIGQGMPDKTVRTTAMFSATFPKEIQILAKDFLKNDYVFLAVGRVGSTSENIEQRLMWVEEMDKRRELMQLIMAEAPENLVLIFVETKRGANDLAYFLNRQQIRSVSIHGDLKQMERERNLEMFRSGEYPILVATAVAARGLDIPNVRHVINYDLPGDSDEYVHRIGRTGRCGNVGIATSFFTDKNRGIGRDLLALVQEANQEVPEWLHRVAAEGRTTGNSRQNHRRFGAVDHRRGGGSGGYGGYSNFNQNSYQQQGQTQSNGFGSSYNSFGGGPRRPFAQNGGFGAGNGLSNGFGNGTAPRRGGFNGPPRNNGGGFYSNNGGHTPIDQWQAPSHTQA